MIGPNYLHLASACKKLNILTLLVKAAVSQECGMPPADESGLHHHRDPSGTHLLSWCSFLGNGRSAAFGFDTDKTQSANDGFGPCSR